MPLRPTPPLGSAAPIALLVLAAIGACSTTPPAAAPPRAPRPVRLADVRDTITAAPVVVAGTLGAREQLPLAFKVGGIVSGMLVDAGARVQAGQLLARLDPREIDAGVTKARAALEKAERDLGRLERLLADSVVTRSQTDDARTSVTVARAELQAVEFNRGRAVIVAPAAGVVLQRLREMGEQVESGQPVFVFGSGARGQAFRAGLVDRDALRVRPGDRASLVFDAVPGRQFTAIVAEIAGAATAGTGTFEAVLTVTGAAELPSGLVGRAQIEVRSTGGGRVVPIEALVDADGEYGVVFAYEAPTRRARRRVMRIAALDGRRVAISSGLADVRQVVTDGAAYLDDGDLVGVAP